MAFSDAEYVEQNAEGEDVIRVYKTSTDFEDFTIDAAVNLICTLKSEFYTSGAMIKDLLLVLVGRITLEPKPSNLTELQSAMMSFLGHSLKDTNLLGKLVNSKRYRLEAESNDKYRRQSSHPIWDILRNKY